MATFSSAHLRERDERLLQKFAQEKAELERKIQKIKYRADETAKNLFDAVHRGSRLARSLGFEDVYDAQVAIDSTDYDLSFRDCLDRVQTLEVQLVCEKKEVEILNATLRKKEDDRGLENEVERLNEQLRESEERHKEELRRLEERYDALKDVKERAAERYKADFKKWRDFSKWLFTEDDEHRKHRKEAGISKEEKKKRDMALILRKRQKMMEIGPDLDKFEGEQDDAGRATVSSNKLLPEPTTMRNPPPLGRTDMEADKENVGNWVSSPKKRPEQTVSPGPLRETRLKSVTNMTAPSSSPTVFFSTTPTKASGRTPLMFHSIPDTIQIKQEPTATPSPMNSILFQRSHPHLPNSSDTEDDSQAVHVPSTNPRSGKTAVFKVPAPPLTTKRNDESSRLSLSLPSRPSFSPDARKSLNLSIAEAILDREADERPFKVRRMSGQEFGHALASPRQDQPSTVQRQSSSREHHDGGFVHSTMSKGKGRDRENLVTPLASKNVAQKNMDDYSAFKGRGRYGGNKQPDDTTINAMYTIDPNQNGGRDYRYDEVVRNKDDRRKMNAGDCECCREYYKSVGPLPKRLQQPLWGSPPGTPSKPCQQHTPEHIGQYNYRSTSAEVESHKKAISRHRHTWARASTPPGYWDIGFPNTQEVGNINEKAKELHKRKKDEVDKEARSEGGRYRRRKAE